MASAIFLIVQAIGKPLGLKISEDYFMSVVNAILGALVVFGIISRPSENINSQSLDESSGEDKEEAIKENKSIKKENQKTENQANIAQENNNLEEKVKRENKTKI